MLPKVGLCFMVQDKQVHEDVWSAFFDDPIAALMPVAVHAYSGDDRVRLPHKRIPTRPTAWSSVSLVLVEYELYKTLFADPDVAVCCLLSESCVPTVTAPRFYNQALAVKRVRCAAIVDDITGTRAGDQFKVISRSAFKQLDTFMRQPGALRTLTKSILVPVNSDEESDWLLRRMMPSQGRVQLSPEEVLVHTVLRVRQSRYGAMYLECTEQPTEEEMRLRPERCALDPHRPKVLSNIATTKLRLRSVRKKHLWTRKLTPNAARALWDLAKADSQ